MILFPEKWRLSVMTALIASPACSGGRPPGVAARQLHIVDIHSDGVGAGRHRTAGGLGAAGATISICPDRLLAGLPHGRHLRAHGAARDFGPRPPDDAWAADARLLEAVRRASGPTGGRSCFARTSTRQRIPCRDCRAPRGGRYCRLEDYCGVDARGEARQTAILGGATQECAAERFAAALAYEKVEPSE